MSVTSHMESKSEWLILDRPRVCRIREEDRKSPDAAKHGKYKAAHMEEVNWDTCLLHGIYKLDRKVLYTVDRYGGRFEYIICSGVVLARV